MCKEVKCNTVVFRHCFSYKIMMYSYRAALIVALLVDLLGAGSQAQTEDEARTWVASYNYQAEIVWFQAVDAEWEYNTNLTDYNLESTVGA